MMGVPWGTRQTVAPALRGFDLVALPIDTANGEWPSHGRTEIGVSGRGKSVEASGGASGASRSWSGRLTASHTRIVDRSKGGNGSRGAGIAESVGPLKVSSCWPTADDRRGQRQSRSMGIPEERTRASSPITRQVSCSAIELPARRGREGTHLTANGLCKGALERALNPPAAGGGHLMADPGWSSRMGLALVVALIVYGCATGASPSRSGPPAPTATLRIGLDRRVGACDDVPPGPIATVGGTWTTAAPLPAPRSEIARPSSTAGSTSPVASASHAAMLDEFVVYDPATDAWTALAPLPEPRHHAADRARRPADPDGRRRRGLRAEGEHVGLRPGERRLDNLAPMPAPRRAHAAVAVDGVLYVVGGVVEGETLRAPTWAYDPAVGEWRTDLADLPTYREHLAAVAVDGGLIAIGGRGTQSVDAVERYDPATDTWTALPPLPAARGGLAAARLDDTIHVFGGESIDPLKIFRDHEVLDLATGAWALGAADGARPARPGRRRDRRPALPRRRRAEPRPLHIRPGRRLRALIRAAAVNRPTPDSSAGTVESDTPQPCGASRPPRSPKPTAGRHRPAVPT